MKQLTVCDGGSKPASLRTAYGLWVCGLRFVPLMAVFGPGPSGYWLHLRLCGLLFDIVEGRKRDAGGGVLAEAQ